MSSVSGMGFRVGIWGNGLWRRQISNGFVVTFWFFFFEVRSI